MKNYRLLTLDIWDTIIRRDCHPDMIKDITSRYLFIKYQHLIKDEYKEIHLLTKKRVEVERKIGEKNEQLGFDNEYTIYDVFSLWCKEVLFDNSLDLVQELYLYELDAEKRHAYLDSNIIEEISKYNYEKIGYLSDFYADHNFIDEILRHINCPIQFDYKYVSCEFSINKRSGRLFKKIEMDLNLSTEEHIHLGDNAYSDVKVPNKIGIDAFLYQPHDEHSKRQEREKKYANIMDLIIAEYNKQLIVKNVSGYKTGISVALFFSNYVMWIIEQAIDKNIDTIYYFTREGEFFKQIHDEIIKYNPYNIPLPEARVLEVSRIGTFCASIRNTSINEMFRIWNQYSIQSMKAFFKSLNIEKNKIDKFLLRYGIAYDEVITYPWQDDRIQNMFADKEFIDVFDNEVATKKREFLMYANTLGLNLDDNKRIGIVDIGWRGTIQDNLCYIFENYHIEGFYLGLIPFLNEQPVNGNKYGYLNLSDKANDLLKNVTPIEMLCNSPNGSVMGYSDGLALRKNEETEDLIFYEYTKNVQQAILDSVESYCSLISKSYASASDFQNESFKVFEQLIKYPTKDLAETYFTLQHNEEFGVGIFIDKRTKLRLMPFIKGVLFKKYRKDLNNFLNSTTWPQGYLVKYNMNLANKIYNNYMERR